MRINVLNRCLSVAVAWVFIPVISVLAAWQPGLKAGYLSASWDTDNYPSVTNPELGPHAGATNSFPPWADNRTWVYTGQIYLNGSIYHFAEAIDNNAKLIIDGTTYIDDTIHTIVTKSGPVALAAGWYDVEIRLGNGTGGAGPNVSLSGWTSTKGFGYNIGGADTVDGSDYLFPWDDGNISLFRYDDGTDGIYNLAATDITSSNAVFNGILQTTNLNNLVSVFWGPTDGGTSPAAWSNRIDFAFPAIQGDFSTNVTLAAADTISFYRYYASNNTFFAWAESTEAVLSGEVTIQTIDDSATENTGDNGVFRISRPSTATNSALTVYFSIGGTSVNGLDYAALNSFVIIPEGESSVDIVIEPIDDLDWTEGDETVVLSLEAGSYIIGTASPVSVTLHDSGSPEQWAHSVPILFTGHRGSTLSDFPALIELGTNVYGFSYSDLLSGDYDDLRFTDGSTTNFLHYEVESWDTNGISQVWVKLPALAYETAIRMHWGRAGLIAPAYTTNGATWANEYVAVYHMAEDSGPVKDSSPFGNGVSVYNDIQQGTTGIAGPAAGWPDGANDWLQRPKTDSLDGMGQLTLQTWMYDEQNDANPRGLIAKRINSGGGKSYYFYKHTNRKLNFYVGTTGGEFANSTTDANQWYFTAATYDKNLASAQMKLYLDGEYKSSRDNTTGDVPVYDSPLFVGILNNDYGYSWKGKLDEVRISRAARSGEWLRAEYLNMASNSVFQSYPGATPSLFVDGDPQQYGLPEPAYGTTNLTGGAVVNCSVPAFVDAGGGMGYACAGYAIYSNLVELVTSGSGNSCVYTNSGGADRLVWLWTTQYYIAFTNSGPGTVSTYGGWYDDGSVATCTASGTGGGQFVGWQGDLDNIPTQQAFESISVPVFEPVSLTASFVPPISNSGWARRMAITFSGYDRTETLTNFPMMVKFSDGLSNHFYYNDMLSPDDAGDLRFMDENGTELFYDIEKWDTSDSSIVWVRLPELSTENNRIYALWGNPAYTNPPAYTLNGITWDNGFVAVYHLAEGSEPLKDSSPFGNALGVSGDVQLGTNGIAGPASRWPSATGNDWLYLNPNDSLHGMGQLTLQSWFYDEQNDTQPRGLISKRVDSGTAKSYYFFKQLNRNLFFYVGSAGGQFANTATGSNQWYFAAATYDKNLASDRMKMYLDGTFRSALNNATGDVPVYSSPLRIGILNANYNYGSPGVPCCWEGKLDEVRISAAARSADWVWAEYENVKNHDTFQSYSRFITGMIILFR